MAGIIIEKSKTLCSCEQPMTALYLISQGRVEVHCPGGSYQIGAGDVAGICEICSEIHFLGYTALEDTTIMPYPLTGMDALDNLLQKRPSIARLFILSLFRQYNAMMEESSLSEVNSAELYRRLQADCELYGQLCDRHNVQSRIPATVDEIQACLEDSPDEWLNKYYFSLQRVYMGADCDILLQEPGLSLGILRKGSLDLYKTYRVLDAQSQYRSQIVNCYFNQSENDMFDALTKLYYRLCQAGEDSGGLYESIRQMLRLTEEYSIPQEAHAMIRAEAFRKKADSLAKIPRDSMLQLL